MQHIKKLMPRTAQYYGRNAHKPVYCATCGDEGTYWKDDGTNEYMCTDCADNHAEMTAFASGGKLDGWDFIGKYACSEDCTVCNA